MTTSRQKFLDGAGDSAMRTPSRYAPRRVPHAPRCQVADLPPGWKEVTDEKSGKPYYYNAATGVVQWQKPASTLFAERATGAPRTLEPGCSWRVRLDLQSPEAAMPVSVTATLRFAEDQGFEPPQGKMFVESCSPEGALKLGEQTVQWVLSEDPEDRKDSLWIWGLFSEPLYPFILLQLQLEEPLTFVDGVSIPAGQLYCQVDHRRKDGSVLLGEGTVTYKVQETLKADLVGLSDLTYGEPVTCGSIRFLDTASDVSKSSQVFN